MSRSMKTWLIFGGALILLGFLLFVGALAMLNWNPAGLSTQAFETATYDITEDYRDIRIVCDQADITLLRAEDGKTRLEIYEATDAKHQVSVKNGVLTLESTEPRKWYRFIGFNFKMPTIRVYLPDEAYGALSIETDTGEVELPVTLRFASIDVTGTTGGVKCYASAEGPIRLKMSTGDLYIHHVKASELSLSVSTGDVTVTDAVVAGDVSLHVSTGDGALTRVRCATLRTDGNTGTLSLTDVLATEHLAIERTTGDVKLTRCDADTVTILTDTGDVTGTLLTPKTFDVETDTGRVKIPKGTTGGACRITTDTGDVKIEILP